MLKLFAVVTAALLSAMTAAAQQPEATPPDPDLLCLAGMAVLAASDESEVRDAGVYGTIFYMGKLLGADPAFDLQARLGGFDYARVTPSVQQRCLEEVRGVANRMVAFSDGPAPAGEPAE